MLKEPPRIKPLSRYQIPWLMKPADMATVQIARALFDSLSFPPSQDCYQKGDEETSSKADRDPHIVASMIRHLYPRPFRLNMALFQHHLSELPLTIGVTHSYAFTLLDVLVLDCRKETVQEASCEIAGGLLEEARCEELSP
jgi:hypothetical protein